MCGKCKKHVRQHLSAQRPQDTAGEMLLFLFFEELTDRGPGAGWRRRGRVLRVRVQSSVGTLRGALV